MNEYVSVYVPFKYKERTVSHVKIRRKDWFDAKFYDKDKNTIKCDIIFFEPILTDSGKKKKGTVNNAISFGRTVTIDMTTGEVIE